MSKRNLSPEVKVIALSIMEGLACSRSLKTAMLIRYGEWDQIAQQKVDPNQYADSESYFSAAQANEFLRKFEGLPVQGGDKEAAALSTWWAAEHQCRATNDRLDKYLHPSFLTEERDLKIMDLVSKIRRELTTLIGYGPSQRHETAFGPGSTLSDVASATTVADKMSSVPTLYARSWPYLVDWMSTMWGRAQADLGHDVCEVPGNRYFTVPKDSTTFRTCAMEASIPAVYQRDVGMTMQRRMFRSGIDLVDGQSFHAQVARLGSMSEEIATIDIKTASDTSAYKLVKLLCTPDWFERLDGLRAPKTQLPCGTWVRLEKFSSMGNGFTFELETAIFCAIVRACAKDNHEWSSVSVFGDDIICASSMTEDVFAVLSFFGFTPNKGKTFTRGNFRESCGGDFFNGVAVRPLYLKEDTNEPQDFISLANGIRRVANRDSTGDSRWRHLKRSWFRTLDFIPGDIRRNRGPEALGDVVIHDDADRWVTRETDCIRSIRTYSPVSYHETRWEGFAYVVQMATAVFLAGKGRDRPNRLPNGNLLGRDSVSGYGTRWVPYS